MKSAQATASRPLLSGVASAYSLMEVMIGMSILSVVLLGCIAALPQLRKISYRSDGMRMGFTHLNATIEGYRTLTFDQMDDRIDSGGTSANADQLNSLLGRTVATSGEAVAHSTSQVAQNSVTYTVDSFLQYLDGDDGAIRVTVVVQWTYNGESYLIHSQAVFTEDGLSDKKFSTAN
ncbi:hypothetical protein [Ruficoccus sp. ZRK36]|uniref:hypothetical protein n=1 Tax=Ruficoccus sp. ZRK36 TaxID=2866311 RepID=UPI001C7382B5|nr:hypothetical protein [Ruficoccus sp. ZRK36]QYY36053.1 hypothetical protein K0V07_00960 [Ruficoccus sp. ZRK36]